MIVVTTDSLPGQTCTALGVVSATQKNAAAYDIESAIKELEKQAKKMGADAVVGLRVTMGQSSQMLAGAVVILVGTAVKFSR